MTCPHNRSQVHDSRRVFDEIGNRWIVKRRKDCIDCGRRFSTIEIPVIMTKGNGSIYRVMDRLRAEMAAEYVDMAIDSLTDSLQQLKLGDKNLTKKT